LGVHYGAERHNIGPSARRIPMLGKEALASGIGGAGPVALRGPSRALAAGSLSRLPDTSSRFLTHFHHNSVSKEILGCGTRPSEEALMRSVCEKAR
jgi:hypothetical protein